MTAHLCTCTNPIMKKLFTLLMMLTICGSAFCQNPSSISGTITNSSAQPVSGATVSLLNTNYNTITNAKGEFRINNIPEGKYMLHITSIAYAERSQLIVISGKGQIFSMKLKEASNQLDEVVVTAQKREEDQRFTDRVADPRRRERDHRAVLNCARHY